MACKKSELRRQLPEHLPRRDVTHDVDRTACWWWGGALYAIDETVSEILDWLPASLGVLRIRRPKYGCRRCGSVQQAPAPERSPKALPHPTCSLRCWSPSTVTTPLRIANRKILARHGLALDRSTLAGWVGGACWWLETLQERLADHVFASTKIFAEDTPVPVLDPGRGRTKTGRLWVYVRVDMAAANWQRRSATRSRDGPRSVSFWMTAASSSIPIRSSVPSDPPRSGARTICSPDGTVAEPDGRRCAR